jgi:hypothetical protein
MEQMSAYEIRPFHAGHWSNLGIQIRQVGAPNQLN